MAGNVQWGSYVDVRGQLFCAKDTCAASVRYYADTCGDEETKAILLDVLDTPVSPELLPPKDGVISQKTEDPRWPV